MVKTFIDGFKIINKFRVLTGADNYLGGRDPYKTDNGNVYNLKINNFNEKFVF